MKILVIEDDHRIATSLQKGLNQEGFNTDISFNGDDGLDQASTIDYDLIILDLMLPGVSGLDICKKLRDLDIHTPIIMLTAKSQLNDKLLGFKVGADDYLTKPFSFDELLARINSLTKRSHSTESHILQCGELTMNTKNYQVRRNGQNIDLTSREYSLLEYLLRHHGQILTKEQIISYVWEYDSDILPNTVEVFIKKLRKKIDSAFPEKESMIETVRGFGYRLMPR